MRFLFICGSLEPGKDGVGDYTRLLAGEVVKQGHAAALIALLDKFISEAEPVYECQQDQVNSVRFSASLSGPKIFQHVRQFTNQFNPDYISLQFVPFAFHPKGLPFSLGRHLHSIGENRKWHIMFHEMWIGSPSPFSLKKYILNEWQKRIIIKLTARLQPAVVHTHLPAFYNQLLQMGLKPHKLPLFSNIQPVWHRKSDKQELTDKFVVGFFSQITVTGEITRFLNELARQPFLAQKEISLLFIGGSASHVHASIEAIKREAEAKFVYKTTGYLETTALSEAMYTCDIGITPVPRHALGKSGSIAAFLSHRIPVAAPVTARGYDDQNIGFFYEDLCSSIITTPDSTCIEKSRDSVSNIEHLITIENMAAVFLADIAESASRKRNHL